MKNMVYHLENFTDVILPAKHENHVSAEEIAQAEKIGGADYCSCHPIGVNCIDCCTKKKTIEV